MPTTPATMTATRARPTAIHPGPRSNTSVATGCALHSLSRRIPRRSFFGDGVGSAQGYIVHCGFCAHCRKSIRLGHWALLSGILLRLFVPLPGFGLVLLHADALLVEHPERHL